jgi:hypothetical protein
VRSGEHNTHAEEEPRVEAAAAAAKMGWAASRGAKEEGVETMRPLFGFTLSTNKDCDLMERREREREKKRGLMRMRTKCGFSLVEGQRLDNTNAENKFDQCHSYCLLACTAKKRKGRREHAK